MTREITVHGTVADGFEAVREEFTAVLADERPDCAGQLSAYAGGRRVVDLWAGADTDGNTLYGVYSSTKGAAHLVVALLVQDGTLELDREVGLPEEHEPRFHSVQPMDPTPEQQALFASLPSGPHTVTSIAFNRHGAEPTDIESVPNARVMRAKGPASLGGVASARGLAGLYAAATSEVDGKAPLLKPDTLAAFGQIHSVGYDVVARSHKSFAVGFQVTADSWYPFLGAGTIGHSGAGGSQAFADPRSGLAYGYARRRYAFPGGPAPENERLVKAVHAAALASG